jgi:integrase
MIAPAVPLSASAYLASVYLRERLDLSSGTVHNLKIACKQLDEFNAAAGGGPFLLTDFCREVLIDWMRWLAESRRASPATINGKRACAMAVWADAAYKGYARPVPLANDPRDRVPKRREPERIPVTWTLPEIDRIFAACGGLDGTWTNVPVRDLWVMALLLFWDTGCRLDEVRSALMKNVDQASGTLLCPAENRKGKRKDRVYSLHAQTLDAFRAAFSPREKVFPFPFGERALQKHLSRILTAAGLPCDRKHKFHALRRTAESHAAASRGIQWAADAIGHNVAVAKKSYVSPAIAPGPQLVDALPRPTVPGKQLKLF